MQWKTRQRAKRHNRKAKDHKIAPGTRLLLQKHIIGNKKIGDTGSSMPYYVVESIKIGLAYAVKPLDGLGPTNYINQVIY